MCVGGGEHMSEGAKRDKKNVLNPLELALQVVVSCQMWVFETECGSLNAFGSHKIIGSDMIRRCGLVRGIVVLLEEAG